MHDLKADAITSDLRTSGNTLSLWMIQDDQELDDVFLALGAKMISFEKLEAIQIPEQYLEAFELDGSKEGDSPIVSNRKNHKDIINLTYDSIGDMGMVVCRCLNEKATVKRTRSQMKRLYVDAYKDGRLDVTFLNEDLRDKIIEEADKRRSTGFMDC